MRNAASTRPGTGLDARVLAGLALAAWLTAATPAVFGTDASANKAEPAGAVEASSLSPAFAPDNFASRLLHSLFYHCTESFPETVAPEKITWTDPRLSDRNWKTVLTDLPVISLFKRKSATSPARSRMWASIQPGYGQICLDHPESLYGHNGAGWQEPSCGYVKFNFKF